MTHPHDDALTSSVPGRLLSSESVTPSVLFSAIGGVRGVVESMAPGFLFLIVFTITQELIPSVVTPIAVAVLILLVRLVQRLPVAPAISGGIGIALSAGLAIWTGRAEDNFVGGFVTNAVWATAMFGSLLFRRPLIGLLIRFFVKDEDARTAMRVVRVGYLTTVMWGSFFALRLLVQVPLWAAGATAALAATKLVMGLPLYAALLWISWLMVRSALDSTKSPANRARID